MQLPALPASALIFVNTHSFIRRNITCKEEEVAGLPVACGDPLGLKGGGAFVSFPPSLIKALGCPEKCPLDLADPFPPY